MDRDDFFEFSLVKHTHVDTDLNCSKNVATPVYGLVFFFSEHVVNARNSLPCDKLCRGFKRSIAKVDFTELLIPRLHDTASCQTGCTTGLTTGCIV